ncbi:MAG: hypothetical protein ABII20_07195, partial [Candidatus Omnitrophota bacterium]
IYNKYLININKTVSLLILIVLTAGFLFAEKPAAAFLYQSETQNSLANDQQRESNEYLQGNSSAESVLITNTSKRKVSGTVAAIYNKYSASPPFTKHGEYVYFYIKQSRSENPLNKSPPQVSI